MNGIRLVTACSDLSAIGEIHPIVAEYAVVGDAYRANDRTLFNQHVQLVTDWFAKEQPNTTKRASFEFLFNRLQPFSQSMTLYVLAFLLACASWLGSSSLLRRSAFYVLLLALAIHTFGLVSRMYLQERPPVTNLYSSAIFIGWGAVIVALILERIFKDGIGAACAGAIGFVTLIIAHHLAGSGDTLKCCRRCSIPTSGSPLTSSRSPPVTPPCFSPVCWPSSTSCAVSSRAR